MVQAQLRESSFAKSIRIIEKELGFAPVGFRYIKEFHIETEKELSENEVKTTPLHFVFPLYIDPVVDIIHPKFYEVFKLNSVIGRDKEHKRLKDIADIFALLWFTDVEISEIKSNLLEFYDRENIKRIISAISRQDIKNVASITGFGEGEVERILLEVAR